MEQGAQRGVLTQGQEKQSMTTLTRSIRIESIPPHCPPIQTPHMFHPYSSSAMDVLTPPVWDIIQ